MKELGEILERNGFKDINDGQFMKESVIITIWEDHYTVEHFDTDFLEWLTWYSESLNIPALMGYLSWMDFIGRGYEK